MSKKNGVLQGIFVFTFIGSVCLYNLFNFEAIAIDKCLTNPNLPECKYPQVESPETVCRNKCGGSVYSSCYSECMGQSKVTECTFLNRDACYTNYTELCRQCGVPKFGLVEDDLEYDGPEKVDCDDKDIRDRHPEICGCDIIQNKDKDYCKNGDDDESEVDCTKAENQSKEECSCNLDENKNLDYCKKNQDENIPPTPGKLSQSGVIKIYTGK